MPLRRLFREATRPLKIATRTEVFLYVFNLIHCTFAAVVIDCGSSSNNGSVQVMAVLIIILGVRFMKLLE